MSSRVMMIVTSDETILQQIQSQFNPSSFQTIILDSENQDDQHSEASVNATQSSDKSLTCVICGSKALGRNFGVVACESCKLFFRRNGLKDERTLVCLANNECDVTSNTCRRCLPCRLRKCLSCGMKRDRLLKAEEKTAKRVKKGEEQPEQESSAIRQPVISAEDIPTTKSLLAADDLERIEAIRVAFENRIELASRDGFGNQSVAPITRNIDHFNSHSVGAVRLLEFFKQIPEFNNLNVEDRLTLTKSNLMSIISLYYAVSFQGITTLGFEIDKDVPWDRSVIGSIHGDEIFSEIKHLFHPLLRFAKSDHKCSPLVLIIFILLKGISIGGSTSEPNLLDGMSVYRAHNFHTELLWRYLEKTYGCQKATRIITTLVTRFLSWQILQVKLRSNIQNSLTQTGMDQLSPLMKSLFRI